MLGENAKLELRVDAYNLFSNLNFSASSIDNNILDPNFGQATSALDSRTLDIQALFSF